ncbi:acyl carrier protein [Ideonella sp. DXS22W]|uniref:Acyl carrier protein n=1 Tax=Pseudaquabacterium inlustre TaxID=2984192 RepID=A0ABU9CNF0_9BURK
MSTITMELERDVCRLLDEVLSLGGRGLVFSTDTRLLGAIPELDSMAVVSLITALEDRFAIAIEDDDIDGGTFETVGTLVAMVSTYLPK